VIVSSDEGMRSISALCGERSAEKQERKDTELVDLRQLPSCLLSGVQISEVARLYALPRIDAVPFLCSWLTMTA